MMVATDGFDMSNIIIGHVFLSHYFAVDVTRFQIIDVPGHSVLLAILATR
jgi:hypothetical protein